MPVEPFTHVEHDYLSRPYILSFGSYLADIRRSHASVLPSDELTLSPRSNPNLLNILDGHLVGRPVVELGRARALMRGDRLGALERATIEQIRRDARGPEGVAIGLAEPDGGDAPLDHPEHIHPAQPARAEPARGIERHRGDSFSAAIPAAAR